MNIHYYKSTDSPYWIASFSTYDNPALQQKIFDFCYKNFGPGLGEFRLDRSPFVHRWVNDIKWGEVQFSREEDLTWFLLKWTD